MYTNNYKKFNTSHLKAIINIMEFVYVEKEAITCSLMRERVVR